MGTSGCYWSGWPSTTESAKSSQPYSDTYFSELQPKFRLGDKVWRSLEFQVLRFRGHGLGAPIVVLSPKPYAPKPEKCFGIVAKHAGCRAWGFALAAIRGSGTEFRFWVRGSFLV